MYYDFSSFIKDLVNSFVDTMENVFNDLAEHLPHIIDIELEEKEDVK